MRMRFVPGATLLFYCWAGLLRGQTPAGTPEDNPKGNTGALKPQIETAGSYDAHSGNATRVVNDLHVPGALGAYGLDFTRYWNSLQNDFAESTANVPYEFGASGWSHSWHWHATYTAESEQADDQQDEVFNTAITITFPDGHTTKYKIVRSSRPHGFPPEQVYPDPRLGPPYTEPEITAGWPYGGPGVHDHICNMAPDGSNFWLCRSDGGSVHFVNNLVNGVWEYQAMQISDPHGFRTDLSYDPDGHLIHVEEEGGRWLTLNWSYYYGAWWAISGVQSGTGQTVLQTVTYEYVRLNSYYLVLWKVSYQNDPAPGLTAIAEYNYGTCYGDGTEPCSGVQGSPFPLLKRANDPRYAGAMAIIRYDYFSGNCPAPIHPEYYPDYYQIEAGAIAAEKADTGLAVSSFTIDCYGTRREDNGLGGWRQFYFGTTAGTGESAPAPEGPYTCRGYQLGKLTDFTSAGGITPDLPYARQNFTRLGTPRHSWDGRGIQTEVVVTPADYTTGESGDESGSPSEIHYADGSSHTYDRMHPGTSAALDPARMHNPNHHWLFSQTDERGFTTTYVRDSRRRVVDLVYPVRTEHFGYNDFNQVTTHTLASDAVVTYEYDSRGLLQREYNSVDGYAARREYTYDALDRVSTVSDGRSRDAGKDFSTRMTYNGRHQILTVEYAGTIAGPNPTVTYSYDVYGNCISITDELGHTSFYVYDNYRRCTSYTEPLHAHDWKGTPGSVVPGRTWNWIYDRWIDGVGQRDASSHTANEWRVQIEPAYNAAGDRRVIIRAHDVNNRLVTESTGWIQPAGSVGSWYWGPDGENHFLTYDKNGQKLSFRDPQGRLTTYDYDVRNRLWKTNETVETVPRTTETLYDATGNKTLIKFPDLRTQQWLDYDAFGQPGRFIDERGNATDLDYVWGPMKKLYHVTTHRDKDRGGTEDQVTTFSYDLTGKPTEVLFPDGTHEDTTYEYGQLKTWKTRKNQTKTITYDPRGREQSHSWSDGTPGISRSWDDANRLTSITNIFSSIDFAYDDAGQVLWEGEEIAGSGGRTQTNYYRYPNGTVAHLHYPGGAFNRNDYTSRGQLAATGWDDDDNNWWRKLAAYTYLADGKVSQVEHGNGTTTFYGYDERGFVNSLQERRGPDLLASRTYTRDTRDRIVSFQKGYNPGVNPLENGRGDRFAYDWEGQLTDGWYNALDPSGNFNSWTRRDHFDYDALGNRQGTSNNVASRNSGQNAIQFQRRDNKLNQYSHWWPAGSDYGISYDDNFNQDWQYPGNGVTMADGWIVASYNALNQPIAIWSFNYQGTPNLMWFGYDPLGRCVKRWVGESGDVYSNPATYFHYDGWNMLQEGNNAWGPARVYAHGTRVDEIVWSSNTFTGEQAYHHYDARNHCTLLTDSAAAILEQYEYDAFGEPYFYDAAGNSIGSYDLFNQWQGYSLFGNRFLFTGREWLSALRLFDFRARMYQPELGRFLQPDPKHFAAGDYNLYRYGHNDPVNRSDPTGMADLNYAESTDVTRAYNPENTFVIVGHGNPVNGLVADGHRVSPDQIARNAVANGYNSQCAKVEVVICGSGTGGKDSLVQKIANALAKLTGAHVEASGPNGKDSLTGTKNNETGVVTPSPPTALPDPKFGTPGTMENFKADPPKKTKKEE